MNDDVRALLACTEPSTFGQTLLFDLDDVELAEQLGAETRRTLATTRSLPADDSLRPRTHPSPWLPASEPFDTVVLTVPKSRSRLRMLLSLTASLTRQGGRLILVSPKRGAGAASTELGTLGTIESLGFKAHRRILSVTVREPAPFRIDDWVTEGVIETPDGPMPVAWMPGVFAEGHLDAGTALLLRHLPEHAEHHYDIGTGCGVLSVFMAKRGPGAVCGLEPDAFALHATARTMRLNDVGGEIAWGDSMIGHPDDPDDLLDLVMSNPPFHEGLERTTAATERLLREAATLLRTDGELRIVANRFLPYERVLDVAFGRHEILAEDGRYRIWRAWRPVRAG